MVRKWLWEKKTNTAKLTTKPKLCTLPPTDEALELNIKRAHFQAMIWYSALESDPPDIDPCNYGWKKEEETKTLQPIMLPSGTIPAPEKVLRSTRCGCKSTKCSSCSCAKVRICCTEFCACKEHGDCCNPWNVRLHTINDSDESDNDIVDEFDENDFFYL